MRQNSEPSRPPTSNLTALGHAIHENISHNYSVNCVTLTLARPRHLFACLASQFSLFGIDSFWRNLITSIHEITLKLNNKATSYWNVI